MAAGNIVIVGGGLAGATAARTLRAHGHAGPVILLAAERHHPYLRPPLSKEYLLGKADDDALPQRHGANGECGEGDGHRSGLLRCTIVRPRGGSPKVPDPLPRDATRAQ